MGCTLEAETGAVLTPTERQRLAEERSELRQSLRGLDDQRAALVRKIARIERELAGGDRRIITTVINGEARS